MKKLFLGLLFSLVALAGSVDAQVHTNGATLGGRGLAQRIPTAFILCKSYVQSAAPGDTNEDTLFTCTVPANALGANGGLRVHTIWSHTNSGNNKTLRVRFSGASGTQYLAAVITTTNTSSVMTFIGNRNATNSQIGGIFSTVTSSFGTTTNGGVTSAVDTTAATSLVATCQKASGGESCALEAIVVELISDGT
jgi:hypothetical protein